MKIPKVSDIIGIINKIAPPGLAESWDNSGLQIGSLFDEAPRIMVALDASAATIGAAIDTECRLLVTHHPLIFTPLKTISAATSIGRLIHDAIRGGLSVVAMHTNYDSAEGGLNDVLASRLGVSGTRPLQVTGHEEFAKLTVFVPGEHLEQVRSALTCRAEQIGAYRDCSFAAPGEGTFTPLDGSHPYIGEKGKLTRVNEFRLELLVNRNGLPRILKTLLEVHPYEEPAFDIYPVLNEGKPAGLGRVGALPHPVALGDFALSVQRSLKAPGLRYVGEPEKPVRTVALCSGSGASLLREAARAGADVLVTGDVKYHDARDAEERGIALVDAGHFSTEIIMAEAVAGCLRKALLTAGFSACDVLACSREQDPFRIL